MSKKFKLGIIGCGKVSLKHIKAAIHNSNLVELVALADTNELAIDNLIKSSKLKPKQKHKIKKYKDYSEMLEKENLDIVAVTTPSGTHAKIGSDVINKNIHLFLEKPMTLSLDEAKQLDQLSNKNNVKIALGHIYRFFPLVDIISKDIENGVFGKVLYGNVKVFWGHGQDYYDQAPWRGTWKQDGGVLMNQSVHALDLMMYLMGGQVSEVCAMLERQTHDMEAEDLALGIMKFNNKSYCSVECTTNTDPHNLQASFFILLNNGTINAGIKRGKPFFDIRGKNNKNMNFLYIGKLIRNTLKEQGVSGLLKFSNPHSGILRDLCLSIKNDSVPRADGTCGVNSLELVLSMYKSAKTKSFVNLPLDNFSTDDMQDFFNKYK